jgi:hypothetical protein
MNMRAILFVLAGLFLFSPSSFAAEVPKKETAPMISGAVDCFDYYHFGSVQVDFSPTLSQTVPGATLFFQGTIKNENTYPIVDGSVYVKIFKRVGQSEQNVADNGYPVVDQFMLPESYTLPAKGEKQAEFHWMVPVNAEGGEYYAAFFFQSARHYNLQGLSFTDDVVGNQAHFTVTNSDGMKLVAFDKNAVTLNGEKHRFANFPLHFKKDESVTAKIKIQNPKTEVAAVSLIWKHYAWDALRPEMLADTQGEIIELQPGETRTVEYTAQPISTAAVSYVVVEMHDGTSKSFLGIRFQRDGVLETNVNFPGVTSYPLQAGVETEMFACVHGTNFSEPVIKDNILTLTLRDMSGNVIDSYQYQGDVTANMMGFAYRFVPKETYTDFTLTTTLEHDGRIMEDVTQTYRCQDIDPKLCPQSASSASLDITEGITSFTGLVIVGVTVFFGLLVVFVVSRKKRRGTMAVFLLVFFMGLGFSGASVEAKSVTWGNVVNWSMVGSVRANMSVLYKGDVYSGGVVQPDGTALPVGAVLNFRQGAQLDTDTHWFATGGGGASPFGAWDTPGPRGCYRTLIGDDICGTLQVNSPTVTIAHVGTAGLACWNGGFDCNITSPGTIVSSINFAATTAVVSLDSRGDTAFVIPAQSIPFSLSAYAVNNAPNAPALAGPASGNQNASLAFSATATDPDGDNIRYLFDWNSDGVGDEWSGGGGWVASGTSQSLVHTWITPGTYTFQVKTQDAVGSYSGWTSKTVTINAFVNGACGVASTSVSGIDLSTAPIVGLCSTGTATAVLGTGPWTWNCNGIGAGSTNVSCQADLFVPAPVVNLSISPANVDLGDSATLTWSVLNPADTCVASSVISASWNGARATSGSEVVIPTASGNYTLTCTNTAEGKSGTKTVGIVLNNKLKICENSCDSALDRTGQTFIANQGPDRHLKACFNPYPSCTNVLGNVTPLAFWNDTNVPNNAFSFPVHGELRPLPFNRTENFDVSYGGVTKSAVVQVACIPNTCSIAAAKAVTDTYCPEVIQDTSVPSGCDGLTLVCPGTRHCDYNVKEVTP